MNQNCIFCKIVSGEAEAVKIYEDESILAFMDIQPVRTGQVLVIPKYNVDHFSDISEDLATKIFQKAHEISRAVKEKLHPDRVGLLVHGYGVAHAHMIVVPQEVADDITSARLATIEGGTIVFKTEHLPFATREELERVARILAA